MSITIVIPAYNEEADIVECLEAIAAQQLAPDEVLLVDNNSTDRTVELAKRYPFVTVINEPRQGVLHARNTGFNAARGDIIGRIDIDTYLPPDWTTQLARIFEDSEIAAVTGPVFYKDMPAQQLGQKLDMLIRQAVHQYGREMKFLFGTNMAIRADAWRAVRGIVCDMPDFHEDVDLAIHLDEQGFTVAFDRHLVAGMSSRRLDDNMPKFYRYMRMLDRTYSGHGIDSQTIKIPGFITLTAYPGLKLLRRAYNPQTQRFSLHKFLRSQEARKNPMDEQAGD